MSARVRGVPAALVLKDGSALAASDPCLELESSVVLSGGRMVDGSGVERRCADVVVRDGRIVLYR